MKEQNNVPDYSILREKAGCIYDRLVQHFGIPEWPELAPLDELINTILSQNTNDRNRDVAYGNLRDRFSSWDEVREAPIAEVIDCIRSAGLANQKGPRIQAVLNRIYAENGSLSLGLRPSDLKMTADQAHDHLALLFSPENYRTAHINLILLGRRICAARNPNCSECFLNDVCDYFFSNKHE